MNLFVVTFNEYERYESDYTEIRAVFDTQEKATDYINNHKNEVYDCTFTGAYFGILPLELNKEIN